MKYISKEDEDKLKPYYIDVSLAEEKGLTDGKSLNNEYFELYSIYYKHLLSFLNEKLNIVSWENYLDNVNNNFRSVQDCDKDLYQYLSSNKYFYIRNTLYVEKLSLDDIVYLLKNSENYDDKVREIIYRTFQDVISSNVKSDREINIFYGPNNTSYAASPSDLVLGFRFAEEDESLYESEDKWFSDFNNRRDIIYDFISKLPTKIGDINIKYIEYFEESVKKKINNQIKFC